MIVTVPNTGTRSLRQYLGNTSWMHFGRHTEYLTRTEPISTTVRDPLRTLITWIDRHGGEMDVLRCHDIMIDYLADYHSVDYYQTEKLPVHKAKGEPSRLKSLYDNHDMGELAKLDSVQHLIEWMKIKQVRDFFRAHHDPLWWI